MTGMIKIFAMLAIIFASQVTQVSGADNQPRKPTSNPFQLYAWGDGIPGFPVMSAEGKRRLKLGYFI
jgi:hypothetical protein